MKKQIESPGDQIVKKRGTAFFEPWIKYAEMPSMVLHPLLRRTSKWSK